MSRLDEIVSYKRQELAQRQHRPNVPTPEQIEGKPAGLFKDAVSTGASDPIRLILEVKPASPSAGVLAERLNLPSLMGHYNPSASAISVLTDTRFFQGSFSLLSDVKRQTPHPVLCKDFILDAVQVLDAFWAGADAVLLIAKVLTDQELLHLNQVILGYGMQPVIEIQNEAELARVLPLNPNVLLVNNRNLDTFEMDLETSLRLIPQIPAGIRVISASGIQTRADRDRIRPVCSTFLIGSALMRISLAELPDKLKELAE